MANLLPRDIYLQIHKSQNLKFHQHSTFFQHMVSNPYQRLNLLRNRCMHLQGIIRVSKFQLGNSFYKNMLFGQILYKIPLQGKEYMQQVQLLLILFHQDNQ